MIFLWRMILIFFIVVCLFTLSFFRSRSYSIILLINIDFYLLNNRHYFMEGFNLLQTYLTYWWSTTCIWLILIALLFLCWFVMCPWVVHDILILFENTFVSLIFWEKISIIWSFGSCETRIRLFVFKFIIIFEKPKVFIIQIVKLFKTLLNSILLKSIISKLK